MAIGCPRSALLGSVDELHKTSCAFALPTLIYANFAYLIPSPPHSRHRPNLNESQRAMVAARLVTTKLGDNQFTEGAQICAPSQSEAAALLTVSTPSVKRAQALGCINP